MVEPCISPAEIQEGDLVAYIDGDASPAIARHIARCSTCTAEVEALRSVDSLLSSALCRSRAFVADSPLSYPRGDLTHSVRPKAGPKLRFGQGSLAWMRRGFQRSVSWQMALASMSVFVLLGILISFYYVFNQYSHIAGDQRVATVAITVEEASGEIVEVVDGAAIPDVNQRIIRHTIDRISVPAIIVDRALEIAPPLALRQIFVKEIIPETATPDVNQRIIRHTIDRMPVSVIIVDRALEIAPPLALRQIFVKEIIAEVDTPDVDQRTIRHTAARVPVSTVETSSDEIVLLQTELE